MAGDITYLQNSFVLVYRYIHSPTDGMTDAAKQAVYKTFRFDNIVKMDSSLDMGLYTEGTGNLAYSKGATNPVSFTFRKTLEMSEDSGFRSPYEGKRRFNVIGNSNPLAPTSDPYNESSIFEWAEALNKGEIDSATAEIYATIKYQGKKQVLKTAATAAAAAVYETVNNSDLTSTAVFITLENAFPVSAIIKRNPYKGVNVAELTFVADSMKTTPSQLYAGDTTSTNTVTSEFAGNIGQAGSQF